MSARISTRPGVAVVGVDATVRRLAVVVSRGVGVVVRVDVRHRDVAAVPPVGVLGNPVGVQVVRPVLVRDGDVVAAGVEQAEQEAGGVVPRRPVVQPLVDDVVREVRLVERPVGVVAVVRPETLQRAVERLRVAPLGGEFHLLDEGVVPVRDGVLDGVVRLNVLPDELGDGRRRVLETGQVVCRHRRLLAELGDDADHLVGERSELSRRRVVLGCVPAQALGDGLCLLGEVGVGRLGRRCPTGCLLRLRRRRLALAAAAPVAVVAAAPVAVVAAAPVATPRERRHPAAVVPAT
ncbi:MAG: hypothetical protein A07HB70_00001, partial [uncultured archaeon A07HB70]